MASVRVRRRGSEGFWYEVESATCDECGCPYQYAVDDPYLVWEPGDEVRADCLDPLCDCHVMPTRSWTLRHNMDRRPNERDRQQNAS
jgi:hypothetical protein